MDFTLSRNDLLKGNLYKGLIRIAIPLIFLSIINTMYGVVDTYFVGRLGEIEVGAVSIVTPITACGSAFSEGLCVAGISLISRKLGQGDPKRAKEIAIHLLAICFVLGVIAGVVVVIFGKGFLAWLNVPSEMINDAYRYLLGISIDFIFLFTLSMYQAIRQASGDSKSGVKLNTYAALLNCILDPIFIFGFGLGTFGAAFATSLSKAIVTPIALYRLRKDDIKLTTKTNIDFKLLKEIVLIALPTSAGSFMASFGFVLMSKEIAIYGSSAISGYGVGSKIASIYYIFVNCWGSGLTTFIGTALGAKDVDRAKKAYRVSMVLVIAVAIIAIPLAFYTSESLTRLFIKNVSDEVLSIAINYTYYCVFTSFCMGWLHSLVGVFNGSGNTFITMLLEGARMWFIRIPLIKLLNSITSLGVTNVWLAMCISNLIVCLVGTGFYMFYKWPTKKLRV